MQAREIVGKLLVHEITLDQAVTAINELVRKASSDLEMTANHNKNLTEALNRLLLTENGLQTGINHEYAVAFAREALKGGIH